LKETAIKLLFIGHVSTGHLNSFILSHFLYTCDHAHTHTHNHALVPVQQFKDKATLLRHSWGCWNAGINVEWLDTAREQAQRGVGGGYDRKEKKGQRVGGNEGRMEQWSWTDWGTEW